MKLLDCTHSVGESCAIVQVRDGCMAVFAKTGANNLVLEFAMFVPLLALCVGIGATAVYLV